jgi:hypothetical protein
MGALLDSLNEERPDELYNRSRDSLDWFRQNLRLIKVRSASLLDELDPSVKSVELGKMYMFFYDAKTQDKLPYWDYFPLCIPIKKYNTGFMGLNLHYISPRVRLKLLDQMYSNVNEDAFGVNYRMVKSMGKLKWAKPCIKQYLYGFFASYIKEVQPEYWDMVSMLPSTKFNTNANTVYAESMRKI